MSLRLLVPLAVCVIGASVFTVAAEPAVDTTPGSAAESAPKADARITAILKSLGQVKPIEAVALSPDGHKLAWVIREQGKPTLEVASVDGHDVHRVGTAKPGTCQQTGPAWAPDSKHLAFLSDCAGKAPGAEEGNQTDIFVADTGATTAPVQLSHLKGYAQALNWTADGKTIGFLYVEGGTRRASALAASKAPSGEIGVDDVEIQRVATIAATGGDVHMLTPADLHVYEFAWAADASRLTFVAAPAPGDNNWWISQLYVQAAQANATPTAVFDPGHTAGPLHGLQIAVPRFSPDGSKIAFIGGLMSDQGETGGDIYLVPSAGGAEPESVTQGTHTTSAWLAWTGPQQLTVSEIVNGSSQVSDYRFASPALAGPASQSVLFTVPATIGDGRLNQSLSLSDSGHEVAFVQSSFAVAPEVFVGHFATATGGVRHLSAAAAPVTAINKGLVASWGKAESVQWENEGFKVQGWLIYPVGFDPSKTYPMIVSVHGGPSSAIVPRWPGVGFGGVPFSGLGYFVFMPNPRGSYGQGEAFVKANRKDFGYGDLRDILTGVDAVEKKHPVDDKRLGLTGWSFGGYMTMFAGTQTQRFRAAVAGAGVSDWTSYYGENLIDQWMTPFFGASVYDDPAVYAKSSPINFIKQVKTPTLIVVGDRDAECPAPQSFEYWHALRAQKVPTSLVVYPNEGHSFASDEHRRDVLERALAWFEKYLPASE
jgi:dipeptidyl aminopeptidase/acylaminoacyl peptidase